MKIPVYLILGACLCGNLSAQKKIPKSFKLSGNQNSFSDTESTPSGNFVTVIKITGDTVFTANERGMSVTTNGGFSWQSFSQADGIYKEGISSINYHNGTIYVTTFFDTTTSSITAGGGISYSKDFGQHWFHISQPLDTSTTQGIVVRHRGDGSLDTLSTALDYVIRNTGLVTDTIQLVAIKTAIQNFAYNIAVTDTSIYMACFAGGLRVAKINPDGSIGYFSEAPLPTDLLDEVRADT